MTILVVSIGNSLRRDDSVGHILSERLVEIWRESGPVNYIPVPQLTPELSVTIAAPHIASVVFVDATTNTKPVIRCETLARPRDSRQLGHHITPATLLLYADNLFDWSPPAWLITVPGFDFSLGEGLSRGANRLVSALNEKTIVKWGTQIRAKQFSTLPTR